MYEKNQEIILILKKIIMSRKKEVSKRQRVEMLACRNQYFKIYVKWVFSLKLYYKKYVQHFLSLVTPNEKDLLFESLLCLAVSSTSFNKSFTFHGKVVTKSSDHFHFRMHDDIIEILILNSLHKQTHNDPSFVILLYNSKLAQKSWKFYR